MQPFVAFLLVGFAAGGTGLGRWVRARPLVLIPLCTIAAAAFYSLRVAQ